MGGATTGGGAISGATVAQPAASKARTTTGTARTAVPARCRSVAVMGWFLLETLVALAIAVGIVWWTMGPKRRKPPRDL